MSDKDAKYFQFPLCLLAYEKEAETRMRAGLDWCIMDVGLHRQAKLGAHERAALKDFPSANYPANWKDCPQHRAMILGMGTLNMQGGHSPTTEARAKAVSAFFGRLQQLYGESPTVRIASKFVWEVLKDDGITWREFSIYCALLSWIGNRSRAWISRSVLQHRALGYKTAAMMEAELANRLDGEKPLTPRQIGYVLDKLHEGQFFARVRKDPWHTYYSVRMSQKELEADLIRTAVYRPSFHHRRVKETADFMARLNAAKEGR